jgi:DNA primase
MHIDQETIENIKNQADIVEIIGEHLSLRRRGANYIALSPFTNEKTPSFVVSPDKQIFKDFSSGKAGNVFKFLMEINGMSFPESVEFVAGRLGIQLKKEKSDPKKQNKLEKLREINNLVSDFYVNKLKDKSKAKGNRGGFALEYFIKRGFNYKTIVEYGLGFSPDDWESTHKHLSKLGFDDEILLESGILAKSERGTIYDRFRGRAIFPIKDYLGRIIGFGGRQLESGKKSAKYVNSPQGPLYDKSKTLYGIFHAKNEMRNKGETILVEGYADVISLHQAGIKNAVASSGTALTSGQIDLITRYSKKIYFIYDSDDAGIKAADKGIDLALEKGLEVRVVDLPEGEDPDSVVQNQGTNTFNSYLGDSLDFISFKIKAFKRNNSLDSASDKSELIRNLVASVQKIPDVLQHDHYISRIGAELALSAHQIDLVYSEGRKIKSDNKKKNKSKSENNLREIDSSEQPRSSLGETFRLIDNIPPEEQCVLRYALQDFNNFNKLSDYDFSTDYLKSQETKNIFSIVSKYKNERGSVFDIIETDSEVGEMYKDLIAGFIIFPLDMPLKMAEAFSLTTEFDFFAEFKTAVIKLAINYYEKEQEKYLNSHGQKINDSDFSENYLNLIKNAQQWQEKYQELINQDG